MNMQQIMAQAQRMQKDIMSKKDQIDSMEFVGKSDWVNVTFMGSKEIKNVNIDAYDKNRKAIYEGLTKLGFECVKPEGAFYLFVKSPVEDETVFCEAAKKHNILMVPASSFGCPGYVRIAYCVSYETIVNSLPHFAEVAKEMGL